MTKQKTPFERGKAIGQWTLEQIEQWGFSSPEACLAHQESVYQEEIEALPRLYARDPEKARQQAEYIEGIISGARESLKHQ